MKSLSIKLLAPSFEVISSCPEELAYLRCWPFLNKGENGMLLSSITILTFTPQVWKFEVHF